MNRPEYKKITAGHKCMGAKLSWDSYLLHLKRKRIYYILYVGTIYTNEWSHCSVKNIFSNKLVFFKTGCRIRICNTPTNCVIFPSFFYKQRWYNLGSSMTNNLYRKCLRVCVHLFCHFVVLVCKKVERILKVHKNYV